MVPHGREAGYLESRYFLGEVVMATKKATKKVEPKTEPKAPSTCRRCGRGDGIPARDGSNKCSACGYGM